MNLSDADVIDVLRCTQKDEQFTDLYASYLSNAIRLCGNKQHNKLTNAIHPLAKFLYYSLTSLSNLQTLGEEYTGILRFVKSENNIPNKGVHIVWLLLFIGGESLFNKSLDKCERELNKNKSLTPNARHVLLNWLRFFKANKDLIYRFNQALFYLNGRYYYISHRLTRIQYVFLRSWMSENSSKSGFNVLGKISMLYLVCTVIHKLYRSVGNKDYQLSYDEQVDENPQDHLPTTREECFICAEIKTNPSALPCGHVFCWKCIFSSIAYELKCPVCREIVQPSRVIMLQNY